MALLKSKYTARPEGSNPFPSSHIFLIALEPTSRGTRFPYAGYILSKKLSRSDSGISAANLLSSLFLGTQTLPSFLRLSDIRVNLD